ncbi:MAG: M48 family metallopeptidase [Planctomycetota bacterium]|nr:M48 family metallopeptidase [Planctomycetota bacterium]
MQIFPILVVVVILAADSGLAASEGDLALPAWGPATIAIAPILAILLMVGLWMRWCRRRLGQGRSAHLIMIADRLMHLARWLVLADYAAAVLLAGWLRTVRHTVGDLVLVDELLTMLPPILGAAALWWLHYPIDRALREALLMRRLDLGKPVYPMPGRWRYVFRQLRLHIFLLLVPILLILGSAEAISLGLARLPDGPLPEWAGDAATFAVGLGVFLLAPLMARVLLSVRPLPEGPVRDDLEHICRHHRVRVREFLLWGTDGSMMNAAVMGLIGPLRYVLLTDALIETMTRRQVQAVMAHEVGHVRRHHMPWMVLSLLAVLMLSGILVSLPFLLSEPLRVRWDARAIPWIEGAATGVAALLALIAFGWISRRFERQADTFAVQHLSRTGDDEADIPGDGQTVTAEAAFALHSALQTIARLNTVDPRRRSWRHGSIAWRQQYLNAIIGRPLDALPIDRFIRRLKLAVIVVLVLGGGATALIEWRTRREAPPPTMHVTEFDRPGQTEPALHRRDPAP